MSLVLFPPLCAMKQEIAIAIPGRAVISCPLWQWSTAGSLRVPGSPSVKASPSVFEVGQMTQETVLLSLQTGKSREPSGVSFLEVRG